MSECSDEDEDSWEEAWDSKEESPDEEKGLITYLSKRIVQTEAENEKIQERIVFLKEELQRLREKLNNPIATRLTEISDTKILPNERRSKEEILHSPETDMAIEAILKTWERVKHGRR